MKGIEFKRCPFCDEEIKRKAIKCKHCFSLLSVDFDNIKTNQYNKYNTGSFTNKKYKKCSSCFEAIPETTSVCNYCNSRALEDLNSKLEKMGYENDFYKSRNETIQDENTRGKNYYVNDLNSAKIPLTIYALVVLYFFMSITSFISLLGAFLVNPNAIGGIITPLLFLALAVGIMWRIKLAYIMNIIILILSLGLVSFLVFLNSTLSVELGFLLAIMLLIFLLLLLRRDVKDFFYTE